MDRGPSLKNASQKRARANRVKSLLYPIAAFLHAGGMSKTDAIQYFAAVFEMAAHVRNARKMEHIGHPTLYADVVSTWVRDKRYLDKRGWPRPLPLKGPRGFASLVGTASQLADPNAVLTVLMRYGNIRRTPKGRYSLTRQFFYTSGRTSMAYEPVAYFLSDASATLGRILKRSKNSRGPDLFWQKAESARISEAAARRFAAFAKQRSLVFLEEMDDWLEAHGKSGTSTKEQQRRVGLGIFSIYSDRESAVRP
jgi:Family of unknown function (DUF6502)